MSRSARQCTIDMMELVRIPGNQLEWHIKNRLLGAGFDLDKEYFCSDDVELCCRVYKQYYDSEVF